MSSVRKCGYHGTTQEAAEQIISSGHFNKSLGTSEWLGCGIYFFSSQEEADWWAGNKVRRTFSKKSILQVWLECQGTDFLNLDLFPYNRAVNDTFKNYLDELERAGEVVPLFSSEKEKSCFAIELYKVSHPEIKLIAYTFDAPGKVDARNVFTPRQLQYCVVDEDIIKDIQYVS